MIVLDLHTRDLYHDSHHGSTVRKRGYVVPSSATMRDIIVYIRHSGEKKSACFWAKGKEPVINRLCSGVLAAD
eukprot:7548615-Prorocentrum_lima.AAC.1